MEALCKQSHPSQPSFLNGIDIQGKRLGRASANLHSDSCKIPLRARRISKKVYFHSFHRFVTATLDPRQHHLHQQRTSNELFSKRWIEAQPLEKPGEMHGGQVRPGRPDRIAPAEHILFQGFNWESPHNYPWYSVVQSQVKDIMAAGITDVWLPPPSQSVDVNGYLPSQLYNLNESKYGTKAQLEGLIDALHMSGICCIADIVINHRSGYSQDSSGHWNIFEGGTKDERLNWGPWAVVGNDAYDSGGKGHGDTGESYGAAPDLDHTNKRVQDELTDWMNWLKADIGFDGWRFDFVKGYAPKFTKLYCERTLPNFAVGELWTSLTYDNGQPSYDQNGHRQVLCDWIDGTSGLSTAFDFTTKGILQSAVCGEFWRLKDAQGKPPGLAGWYPDKAVTFIDNHDTGSTQRHWNFPDDKVLLGYVYILTHPGTPCVFYDHFFSWGLQQQIGELIHLRKRAGVNASSNIRIDAAESDIYVANIDEKIIVKLGPRFDMGSLLPDSVNWKLALSGVDFAVWESTKAKEPATKENKNGI
ncbi:hypothetical protein KP509_21G024900 [Ceratopteris richardii]|uniref:Alpha-amylase n=1 Tax=Ceratopteris richardii TaxID=49495 RepID=A0A8T2SB02_CERRI|nr:hypothetical protein KP509_21G024900 [Ceratopteris richardii]